MEYIVIKEIKYKPNHQDISSSSVFFQKNEECTLMVLKDKLIFKKPDLDHKKTHKFSKKNSKSTVKQWFSLRICNKELPEGKYLIDEEESNEDEIIIYFEDKI